MFEAVNHGNKPFSIRVPAWNFHNSRAVKEFDWKIQSVEEMVLDEINGTRQEAGLPAIR